MIDERTNRLISAGALMARTVQRNTDSGETLVNVTGLGLSEDADVWRSTVGTTEWVPKWVLAHYIRGLMIPAPDNEEEHHG